tara:strand:+ start:523 stop:942 length:420 start_codon:yes stop_codon:yes gene_type:complete
MNKQEAAIFNFLKDCNIVFESFDTLDGMLICRDLLLDVNKYENVKVHIKELKKSYSSSSLTSLQSTALKKQRWPLLNLVRQVLKMNDYIMKPIRKSNGYTPDGKKKYVRYFLIHKIEIIEDPEQFKEEPEKIIVKKLLE